MPRDLARDARADRAVVILDVVLPLAARARQDRLTHVPQHALGKLTLVKGRIRRLGAELRALGGEARAREDRQEIKLSLPRRLPGKRLQKLGAADDIGQLTRAQGCENLPHFPSDELEVVDDELRQSREVFRAQHIVLGRNAGGAVVQMADAQILAAERHQRRRAEAEAFGADDGRLHDVQSGLEPPIRLQAHAVTQIIDAQRLVGFGKTQLPGSSRIFDRGERTCAGAAVVT